MASQLYSHQGDNEYRVLSKEGNGALIFSRAEYTAGEHEHPEAQVSILFRGASASLLTHSESGKEHANGNRARVVYLHSSRPAPQAELAQRRRITESLRLGPDLPRSRPAERIPTSRLEARRLRRSCRLRDRPPPARRISFDGRLGADYDRPCDFLDLSPGAQSHGTDLKARTFRPSQLEEIATRHRCHPWEPGERLHSA